MKKLKNEFVNALKSKGITLNSKNLNRLDQAINYYNLNIVLDYDYNSNEIEVAVPNLSFGSWMSLSQFESKRFKQKAFNKSIPKKERGRMYKITTLLKNAFYKYDTTWIEEIGKSELSEIDRIARKYGYSLNIIIYILDRYYSYDDLPGHYFMPGTFDFMKHLFEEKRKRVI